MGAVADFVSAKLPAYLQRPMGQAFNRTFAQVGDQVRDTGSFAFKEAMLESATADSYPAHLRNSALQVLRTGLETAAQQLAVLRNRWLTWRQSGGVEGLVAQLTRLGYPGCTVTTQLDLYLAGNVGAFGGIQGYFFVTIPWPNPFTDPALWEAMGITWDQAQAPAAPAGVPLEWDLEEPYPGALDDIKFTIRKFKPAVTSCRFLQLYTDATTFVNVPMGELWEYAPDGSHPDWYFDHY